MNCLLRHKHAAVVSILLCGMITVICGSEEEKIRKPPLDKQGRFWVYKDGLTLMDKKLGVKPVSPYGIPFAPYAWMPEAASEMIQMTLEHKDRPYEGDMCIAVSVTWKNPYWCGVGFVSGPDKGKPGAPWWGKTDHGWYYDLSGLKKKRFVIHMRGENGGERVQWKVGFLCHEKHGDSLTFPAETKWLKLEAGWTRFELDLRKKDLSKICSLCFVVALAEQEVSDADEPVTFYVDSVYFE